MFNVFDRIIINQSSDESTLGYGLSQTDFIQENGKNLVKRKNLVIIK